MFGFCVLLVWLSRLGGVCVDKADVWYVVVGVGVTAKVAKGLLALCYQGRWSKQVLDERL